MLTASNYQDLARLLPHISAEVLARRFAAQRYSDFKVSELRVILQFLRDKTDGGAENPHWNGRGLQGAKKELLVERVRAGLEWLKKSAGQLRESREMAARQQGAAQQQPAYPSYPQHPPSGSSQAGGSYPAYQSSYPNSAFPPPTASYNNYAGQVPYINNNSYNSQSTAYRSERKDQNGYPPPSSSYPNGFRPSQSTYTAPLCPSPSNDAQLAALLAHPNFQLQRSPYEQTVSVLASALLVPYPPHASNARCAVPFTIPPDRVSQLRRTRQSSALYSVSVRLFSLVTHAHAAWDKSYRVKVNAHEVAIAEPRKLNKTKKKGVELVRSLQLSEWCGQANYLEVEVVRQSYLVEMFRGAVVVELTAERSTDDVVELIRARQSALHAALHSPAAVKQELAPTPALRVWKPNPKRCAVCHGTKDLLRCSRCKNEWYCLAEGTRVTLANHTSIAIESICDTEATPVLSYDPKLGSCVQQRTQAPYLLRQGVKECVELVLEDGRKLVCTPDHRLMTRRGEVQVQHLTAADRVLVAPEGPLVGQTPIDDWTLTFPLTTPDQPSNVVHCRTTEPAGYRRCMAFARLLGCVVANGSSRPEADDTTTAPSVLHMSHKLDADSIVQDIATVLDIHASIVLITPPTTLTQTFAVSLPSSLTRVLRHFGCAPGKQLGQGVGLPPILLDTATPVDFIREAVAAMFGRYGSPPTLRREQPAATWTPVSFELSVADEQRAEAAQMLQSELLPLLSVFDIEGNFSETLCASEPSRANGWQLQVRLAASCTVKFADSVGFRHAVHKQQRLAVAAGYHRGVACRLEQQQRLVDATYVLHRAGGESSWLARRTHEAAVRLGRSEVLLSNVLDTAVQYMSAHAAAPFVDTAGDSLYKPIEAYVNDCGASHFFLPDSDKPTISTPPLTALPAWHLGVQGMRPVGARRTYDLSISHTHLFVANGCVAHNCGIEHQRDHWVTHRQQCHQPTEEQERERDAYEKHAAAAPSTPVAVSGGGGGGGGVVTLASNGRTRLRMPVKVERKDGGADVSVVGEDSDVEEDELAEVDTIVSLKDLLLQDRIKLAVKGRHCSHLPCFDLSTFLELSQQSGVWQCPICHRGVLWDDVVVDAEMNAVLSEVDEECMQIRVQPDGSYEPIDEQSKKKQKTEQQPAASRAHNNNGGRATAAGPAAKYTSFVAGPTSPLSVSPLSTPNSASSEGAIRSYPATNGHSSSSSSAALAAPQPFHLLRSTSPAVDFLDNVDAPQLSDPNLPSAASDSAAYDRQQYAYARRDGGDELYGNGGQPSLPSGAEPSSTYPMFAGQAGAQAAYLSGSSAQPPAVGGASVEDAIVIDDD